MGAKFSKPTSNPLRNVFSCFKCGQSRQPSFYHNISPQPSIFATLKRRNVPRPNEFIHLFSNCISAATARTQEYLTFKDPEDKLRPSPDVLTQVFLMTYITRSVEVNLQDTLNCTVMTPEQRVLLGADWVWAVLERPTKNPKFQIVVQVLHLSEREEAEQKVSMDTCSESIQMAQMESSNNNMYERMVNFCTSIGKDCYALFLFFGKKTDKTSATAQRPAIFRSFLMTLRWLDASAGMMRQSTGLWSTPLSRGVSRIICSSTWQRPRN
uniref:RAB15 effector protein n=1 Tax=Astatotilapia calliptera TaxID=8154 RepID=A0A3P8PMN5_ASTCA